MSGIAGILYFNGKSMERETLERMLQPLKQRGPHGHDLYMEDNIGLGFTLLDASPRLNEQAVSIHRPSFHLPVTFDGRLDNRHELIVRLDFANPSVSDAELVFAAYKKWGIDCPKHLLGDFSFALWDRKTNKLFCARDHFGVKPFYYHYSDRYFIFASNPYAIIKADKELSDINRARVADYLVDFEGMDEVSTFFKSISRLPRSHCITVTPESVKLQRYWELQAATNNLYKTETEYVEAFHEIFKEAVSCRLGPADATMVPLSGGIDSTAIASVARDTYLKNNSTLYAISAITDDFDTETDRIRSVTSLGKMRSKIFSREYIRLHSDMLASLLAYAEDPFDCLENSWRSIYKQGKEDDIRISLDGVDADILLSGFHHNIVLWREGKLKEFLEETIFSGGLTRAYYGHPMKLFARNLYTSLSPAWLKTIRRRLYNDSIIKRSKGNSVINLEFAKTEHLVERQTLFSSYGILPNSATQIEAHKKSLNAPILQAALERYDRIAAAFSIEPRHPFLDVRLVEFSLGLPWQLKTRHGWTKMILRRSMEAFLPGKVVWNNESKHPNWEYTILLLRIQPDYFRDILHSERQLLKDFIDIKKLEVILEDFYKHGRNGQAFQLLNAIGLASWLRRQREYSLCIT